MNMLSPLRSAVIAAIALSPFGMIQAAQAAPGSIVVPTIPSTGSPTVSYPSPSRPNAPSVVVPIYTPGYPSYPSTYPPTYPTTPGRNPTPTPPQPSRPVVTNPPSQPATGGLIYRVVVMNGSDSTQQQVKNVVPQAFRTSLNGQPIIQAGVFREQSKAAELQRTLNRNNLQATILTGQASEIPVTPPRVDPPASNPGTNPLPSVPRNGTVVVIDPGHGGGDPGAVGIGGIRESEIVLDISKQVVSLLKQQGVEAVLTRSSNQEIELEPRVQFAERADADVFVSIHANAFDASRTDVNGIETYYYSGGSGQPLARAVQDSLLQELGARDRGVRTANFYVIRYTSMPAILVETGFVTGSEDAARLSSASGRSRIAKAIARGILQYLR
ncbi:MAG: N-acetylmuramoyl-L-alanine amidase [Leptolyngbyaceae cyanobacterium bins.302]|nr:N-acetylmuramoyl-L-alanine amidase [Leptolyngbyaceae cyanobacterium bins.302]